MNLIERTLNKMGISPRKSVEGKFTCEYCEQTWTTLPFNPHRAYNEEHGYYYDCYGNVLRVGRAGRINGAA